MTAERVELIKHLRQGDGLTLEKLADLTDEDYFALGLYGGAKTPEAAFTLIRHAALSLLDDQHSLAIKNALALGEDIYYGNLTERRMILLQRMDISLRTLINWEDSGAELIDKQIDMTNRVRATLGEIDVVEVSAQVEQLKARVAALEKHLGIKP